MEKNLTRKNLTLIAGLSGLIYLLVFTWPFPLFQLYSTIPPVDYAKLTHHSPAGLFAYLAGLGALFGLYLWAIRLTILDQEGVFTSQRHALDNENAQRSNVQRSNVIFKGGLALSPQPVFFAGAILAGVLVFSYPLTAIDLFIYAIRTRGYALYGLNPLATAPEALPAGDPWLGLAAEWVDAPSPYGPLWEWLSLAGFYLTGGNFLAHLIALKLIAVLAYLGCAWLIYRILRRLQPEWAIAGTIAFAWSPLVLLESAQNGHNDIVMVFFLLAAVWALVEMERRGREEAKWRNSGEPAQANGTPPVMTLFFGGWRSAVGGLFTEERGSGLKSALLASLVCFFLALSILVKFVTVMVVPFFLWELAKDQPAWPRRLAIFFGFGLLVGGMVVLPMLPLWPGWEQWAVLTAGSQAGRSLLALLVLALRNFLGLNSAFDFSRNLVFAIFALIYLYCLWRMVRGQKMPIPVLQSSIPRLLASSFLVLFWYVLLAVPVFHAWYLLWFLPLTALLLPYRPALKAATVFSITALFVIPYFETIRVWYPVLLENQLLGHLLGVPLLIVPPALALLWPISSQAESEVR